MKKIGTFKKYQTLISLSKFSEFFNALKKKFGVKLRSNIWT